MNESLIVTPNMIDDQASKEPLKKTKIAEGVDGQGRLGLESLTTLDKVKEQHVYLLYETSTKQIIIEADLLGEDTEGPADKKVPASLHIECPECTTKEDRRILSVEYGNKAYELEDLPYNDQYVIMESDGETPIIGTNGNPVVQEKRLTIKEKFMCTFQDCRARYKITDNILQKI